MRKFEPDHDGKWAKMHPVWDGFYTILFTPPLTTEKGSHIRDGIDLKRTMITVVLAMIPALLFGMWNVGHQHFSQMGVETALMENFLFGLWKVLPIIVVSYAVGLGIEFAFAIARGHAVNEGYLVSGMLIPLVMPVDVPLWMVGVSVAFAVVIGKEVFGGTGMNILNPALTARAFLFFAYPTQMSGDKVWVADAATVDGVSGETVLGTLAAGSKTDFSQMNMLIGDIPGSIGETSVIAILLGALLLVVTGIGSWRIILSTIIGGAVMGLIFNNFAVEGNELMAFNWVDQLLVGGFMFGAVFMATDPVSAAQTNKGKWIYGFFCGFFAIMIRVFNPAYPEGMMMAILFMNVMAPTIDHYVVEGNIKKRLKRLKA